MRPILKNILRMFFLCFSLAGHLSAQNDDIIFEHLSVDDGLSQVIVFSVFQDSRGFMWFGTQDGLNRYDGYQFKIFRRQPDDSTSLSGSQVNTIYEDNTGILWIGTFSGGLSRFIRDKENFINYLKFP